MPNTCSIADKKAQKVLATQDLSMYFPCNLGEAGLTVALSGASGKTIDPDSRMFSETGILRVSEARRVVELIPMQSGDYPSTGSGQAPSTGSGQAGTEATRLYKYQWDLIHNPQATTGLLDGMEEGAMVCLGIFDDCKDVLAILRQIKAAAANRQKVTIRKDAYPKGKVFNAYYLDVAGETYYQLRVVYTPVPNDVAVDPLAYTRADRDALAADGTVYRQRGIDFADGDRTVFTIEIGANEDMYEQKYETLRRYLFEQGVYEKKSMDTIRIYITRVHTGSNSTVGLLRTDDGTITGYTVELPRGSDSQCKTICTDKIKPYDCYCIAEGIYNFEINKIAYKKGSPKNHSLRITSAVPDGRLGVLVHGGRDDAKGWSQGCIMPMPNFPEINSELYSSNRNNTVEQSIYFTIEILDWVRLREAEIKKENKDIEKVVKQIIITKTF